MSSEKKPTKKQDIKWSAVLWYIHLHVLGIYGAWLLLTSAKWMTVLFTLFITLAGCLGVTVGAHRMWAHKTFTGTGSLRLFLMLAHTLAGVGPIYDWVLYHRVHHKYYGTDKDPYDHNKGFLYSHYLSNFQSPKVDYETAKIDIDMRDIELDRYAWLQKKFYWSLFIVFGIILPLNAPLEYWDESMSITILTAGFLRLVITLNMSWLVNSAKIVWNIEGNQLMSIFDTLSLLYKLFVKMPKSHGTIVIGHDGIRTKFPPDSMSVFVVNKSFWPAYHYLVPWDWKSGEFGTYDSGCSTFFVKMWRELGLINNLQTVDTDTVREVLHAVSKKKMTLSEGLDHLKEISEYNMKKEELLIRH